MPKPRLPGEDPKRTTGGVTGGDSRRRVEEAVELLAQITDDLNPKDEKFVMDMKDRIEEYGSSAIVSPKQIFWLRDIRDRQT